MLDSMYRKNKNSKKTKKTKKRQAKNIASNSNSAKQRPWPQPPKGSVVNQQKDGFLGQRKLQDRSRQTNAVCVGHELGNMHMDLLLFYTFVDQFLVHTIHILRSNRSFTINSYLKCKFQEAAI